MFGFIKTSDFARAIIFVSTSLGIVIDPAQIDTIVAGGMAMAGVLHAVRAWYKNKSV